MRRLYGEIWERFSLIEQQLLAECYGIVSVHRSDWDSVVKILDRAKEARVSEKVMQYLEDEFTRAWHYAED